MVHKPTERVLRILSLLSGQPEGLSLTRLSDVLGIPKSTLSPILQEMTHQKYLYVRPEEGRYRIGIAAKFAAAAYDPQREIIPLIQEEMRRITQRTNEICQLGLLEGPDVVYLRKEDPARTTEIQIISYVGIKLPAYCTALGKALLSELPPAQVTRLYPAGLAARTPHTVADLAALHRQLDAVRRTKIAYEREEITPYLCCYATPLHIADDQTLALSVSMPVFRADAEKSARVKELLLTAKRRIEDLCRAHANTAPGAAPPPADRHP